MYNYKQHCLQELKAFHTFMSGIGLPRQIRHVVRKTGCDIVGLGFEPRTKRSCKIAYGFRRLSIRGVVDLSHTSPQKNGQNS